MFTFITHFEENKILQQQLFLSLTRIDFAVLISSRAVTFLVGLQMSVWPYHFDVYGPHAGAFFLWFCKEIEHRAIQVIYNKQQQRFIVLQ